MSIVARLEKGPFEPARELAALLEQANSDGAVVSFTGVARPLSKTGQSVRCLVLEYHPSLTERSLVEIAQSAGERFDVSHISVVHRCGEIPSGDPVVFAAAASAHRRAAFDATDYLMDRLKTDAVFWKREVGPAGSEWVEPTETDYRDCERWS